jgi:omega-hydroxy-beta-dihydromenaquinone-9 sulfotransferase
MRHVHEMGLTIAEEDDIALYYSMASGFWITRMPFMEDLDFFRMNEWPERKRRRYNDFYREVVKRQLYLNGTDKIHLSKNPLWAGRVASLIEAFPDARFVVNVRDPRETIPSLLKLLTGAWYALEWDPERQRRSLRLIVENSFASYWHPIEALDANHHVKCAIVDYRELTSDPAAAIERVYAQLDLPLSDAFRETLRGKPRSKRERSGKKHSYSLEEFGLEGDAIRVNLADLFERFGWE